MSPKTKVKSIIMDVGDISDYQLLRLRKIERNKEKLLQLGLIGNNNSRLSCLKKEKSDNCCNITNFATGTTKEIFKKTNNNKSRMSKY